MSVTGWRMPSLPALAGVLLLSAAAGPAFSQEELILIDHGKNLLSDTPYLEEDENTPTKFALPRAFDGSRATCWAVPDGGVGLRIRFGIHEDVDELQVVNGFAKTKDLFARNNRIRELKAVLLIGFSTPNRVTEIGRLYTAYPLTPELTLTLQDVMDAQPVPLPLDWEEIAERKREARARFDRAVSALSGAEQEMFARGMLEQYILSLEITRLYHGSRYNDTCLAEVEALPRYDRPVTPETRAWRVRGADAEYMELQEDGLAFLYSGGRPFGSGTWSLEGEFLQVAIEGFEEPVLYASVRLVKDTLILVTPAGAVEVYEREE